MLGVLQDNSRYESIDAHVRSLRPRLIFDHRETNSDALLVDATLNSLSIIIRTRPGTSNRILSAVLNFNPLKLANSPMTPKSRVLIKSMEKTTRMLLFHLAKR
jgi:symplekin